MLTRLARAMAQVAGEAVELLAAAAFTPGMGLPQPATRLAGFLRFLRTLAGHPWREQPLVVDPMGELGAQARRDIDEAHAQARRACYACAALPSFMLHWGYVQCVIYQQFSSGLTVGYATLYVSCACELF